MESSDALPTRPSSVKELADRAEDYKWNMGIALKYYFRAATAILSEARTSSEEGHYEHAYMLYIRHCSLVLNNLSTHPEAKLPENKHAIRKLAAAVPGIMEEVQIIKPVIEHAYNEWVKIQASQVVPRDNRVGGERASERRDLRSSWVSSPRAKVLDAGEHQDLAVELAQKTLQQRASRRAARRDAMSEQEEHERRTGGVWDDWDAQASSGGTARFEADQDLQRQMAATRRALDRKSDSHFGEDFTDRQLFSTQDQLRPTPPRSSSSSNYHYPSISHPAAVTYGARPNNLRREPSVPKPPRPAKVASLPSPWLQSLDDDHPPPVPDKERLPSHQSSIVLPSWDRNEAPKRPPKEPQSIVKPPSPITFKASAFLENGSPLRPVFLPDTLRSRFLEIAADNTRRGLEMCGILCGTKLNGALFISALLIPEQTCTTDTCETENELAISEFCESNTLEVFGWIHTHPTQTCFMSSRDVHTQAGYQTFLPESIAIVCAPRHQPSWGIFRLTQPPGLPHIIQCRQSATFHEHSIDNIYTAAIHPPGHVYETSRLEFKVEDLRPGFRQSS